MNYLHLRRDLQQRQIILQRALRQERVVRDRLNPFDIYDDVAFITRFRFSKQAVVVICDKIRSQLTLDARRKSIAPEIQLLVTLRFYATRAFQRLLGDTFHISQS